MCRADIPKVQVLRFSDEEFIKLKDVLLVYEWAKRTLLTKLDILNESLKQFQQKQAIEQIKGRLKSPESIARKLNRLNHEITSDNAIAYLKDIAGVRIICPFAKDIYYLVELLRTMPELTVLEEKDYVSNPKPSGYRSYHIIIEVPVFYCEKTTNIPVEIQIRTEAMNFWSTLEHRAKYQYAGKIPTHLSDALVMCANQTAELDERMFLIHEIVSSINKV